MELPSCLISNLSSYGKGSYKTPLVATRDDCHGQVTILSFQSFLLTSNYSFPNKPTVCFHKSKCDNVQYNNHK